MKNLNNITLIVAIICTTITIVSYMIIIKKKNTVTTVTENVAANEVFGMSLPAREIVTVTRYEK